MQTHKITVSQNSTDFILALDISNGRVTKHCGISHIKPKPRGTSKLGYVHSASLIPFTPNTPPTKSSWIQQTAHSQRRLFSDHLSMQKKVEQEHVGSWRKDHMEALQGIPVSFKRQSHPTSDKNHNNLMLITTLLPDFTYSLWFTNRWLVCQNDIFIIQLVNLLSSITLALNLVGLQCLVWRYIQDG